MSGSPTSSAPSKILPVPRQPKAEYLDPLETIWTRAAEQTGLRVVRTTKAYADYDGNGTLAIGTTRLLDADDCIAQLVFHELCHWLIQGRDSREKVNWGLCNATLRDLDREYACLRLQAALADPFGLRRFLANTTDHRAYYDALSQNPLEPADDETAITAKIAWVRSSSPPWGPALRQALEATATIVAATRPSAEPPSLYSLSEPRWALNPIGFVLPPYLDTSCASCAWNYVDGERSEHRCRLASNAPIEASWAACERWEAELSCRKCAACCRAAYGSVEIAADEPLIGKHPGLVEQRDGYIELARSDDRCRALIGNSSGFTCTVYDDRPTPCSDFEQGGEHCATARRRVGLTR